MRRVLTHLNLLFATLPTVSNTTAHAELTDEQALAIARQVVSNLNKGDLDALFTLFDDAVRAAITQDQLRGVWASLLESQGALESETGQAIEVVQELKVVILTLQFKKNVLNANISINAKGEVGGLNFVPVQSAVPNAYDLAPDEQEITFQVGADTFYGTLLIPTGVKGKVPGALLLSGSGPTDRDGNSTLLPGKVDSHKQFARILANAGVASLRYDKIGTGKTGLGSHHNAVGLTFDLYVDTALGGYNALAARPEVDPGRMAFLGHSEGGMIALVAAERLKAVPPAALILAAPISKPFMQTLREQTAERYASAVKAQAVSEKQAQDSLAELDQIIAQVAKDGTTPASMSSQWVQIFSPTNLKFLQQVSRYDPASLAEGLSPAIKVLVLCGQKDQQILVDDAKLVVDGFKRGGNTSVQFFDLVNVNHVFKEIEGVPNLQTDYTDPSKAFSHEAATRITDFMKSSLVP